MWTHPLMAYRFLVAQPQPLLLFNETVPQALFGFSSMVAQLLSQATSVAKWKLITALLNA